MQKRETIITIVLVALLFVGVTVGLYFAASSSYNKRSDELTSQIDAVQTELTTLKAAKDAKGFTPTEVVSTFFGEVKSDATKNAKLYLAPEVQNMDIKATLKLGTDLANISTGESLQQADGDNVAVSMTFLLANNETTVRTFKLSKYDNVWKITGVTAE